MNNLYIVRHGKLFNEDRTSPDYLHLSEDGIAFSQFLNSYFKDIYFDHILFQSIDPKTSDPYNRCRSTVQGTKGVKTEFNKTQLSKLFFDINKMDMERRHVLLCYRSEAYNVICNIVGADSEEFFNKDYNRVFHFQFNNNNYGFIKKINADGN